MKRNNRLTVLATCVCVFLSGCWDSNNDNNSESTEGVAPETVVGVTSQLLPTNYTQILPTPEAEEVKEVTYSSNHHNELAYKSYEDIVVDGNIIQLDSTYKVGDTIELENTVLMLTDEIAEGQFATRPADIFEVFDELEIKTSMQVNTEEPFQTGLSLNAKDVLNTYNDLKDKGCIPNPQAVQVSGTNIHHNNITKFSGLRAGITGCEIFKDDTGSIIADVNFDTGMVADFELSKKKKKFLFNIDGASVVSGKLMIDAQGKEVLTTDIYTFVPDISKSLPKEVATTLSKLIRAEIKLKLKTLLEGKFRGETRIQVPSDFAVGYQAYFNEETKEWEEKSHNLRNEKNVDISENAALSYDMKEADIKVGNYVEFGYFVRLDAETPYFFDDDNTNKNTDNWFKKLINANREVYTGELFLFSKSAAQAGLSLSARAGSEVRVEDCKANLNVEAGFYTINAMSLRVSDQLYKADYYNTDRNVLFGNPFILKSWNLFDSPYNLQEGDWCGPNTKLKGDIGGLTSEVLVTDMAGNVLMRSDYVLGWDAPKYHQGGVSDVSGGIDESQYDWIRAQLAGTKVTDDISLPRNTYNLPLNITFKDSNSNFSSRDEGWRYKWVTDNENITITDADKQTAKLNTSCATDCNLDDSVIELYVISPDNQLRLVEFKPTFEAKLDFQAIASYDDNRLELNIEGLDENDYHEIIWSTGQGVKVRTKRADYAVLNFSKLYQSAINSGSIKVMVVGNNGEVYSKRIKVVDARILKAINTLDGYWLKDNCDLWEAAPVIEGGDITDSSDIYFNTYIENEKQSADTFIGSSVYAYFYNKNCTGSPIKVKDWGNATYRLSNPKLVNSNWTFENRRTKNNGIFKEDFTFFSNNKDRYKVQGFMENFETTFRRISKNEYEGIISRATP